MLIYGKNVFYETFKSNPNSIRKIIIQEGFKDENVILLAKNSGISLIYKNKTYMDKLANGLHQGIIMDVVDYEYFSLKDVILNSSFFVILDHIEDPHNFGAIIRTCEAAGVDAIIIPKDREVLINATVMKTSAASLVRMKIVRVSNLVQTIDVLKKNDFWIVGTDMIGEDYKKIDYTGKVALVIGNEGKGISKLVRKNCDFIASIPMYGDINSLNASVSAGIMIYEVIRNRK